MSVPCRSCGAPIFWARTPADRPMPLDAKPHPEGNVVYEDGIARISPALAMQKREEGQPTYRTHFATCPDAAKHRKRKAKT